MGVNIEVATPERGPKCVDDFPFKVWRYPETAEGRRFYLGGMSQFVRIGLRLRGLAKHVPLATYDLVHATHLFDIEVMALRSHWRRQRYIVTVHGTEILFLATARHRSGMLQPFQWPVRVVTNSLYTRGLLLREFPKTKAASARAVPLGVGRFWLQPEEGGPSFRASHGVAQDQYLVLSVNRIEPRKGNDVVIDALSLLPEGLRSRITYIVIGEPASWAESYAAGLSEHARESGVTLRLLGRLSDREVRAAYAASDIFCLAGVPQTDRIEGFGLVFLEAAGQGVPSIGTRVGGVPEAVIDGVTGCLVSPNDKGSLSRTISRLLTHPTLRKQLGSAAQKRAQELTWGKIASATYEGLIM